ncbi:hypothetical protein EDB84DRAFT_1569541 [Lactarius hengduanensis]|nr:hypothetical protein EDB84DRAFT_1569541 [Lactarius hengduanensis]
MSQVPSNAITSSMDLGKSSELLWKPTQLQSCDSPSAILAILRAQVQAFDQSQSADERLTRWLDPTVNVLYAFSATLGEGVPAREDDLRWDWFLLQAVKDVRASQNLLRICLAAWNTFLSDLKDI